MKSKNIIFIIIVCLLFIVGCSSKKEKEIKYKGLDEIILYEVPKGYVVEENVIYNDDGGIISIHYGDKKSSVSFMILSYKGKAVMGSDETIDEWYKDKDNIVDRVSIKNADTEAYIYPIGLNTDDKNKEVEKSVIEAVFSYKDYLIMVEMFNHEGEDITKEQKIIFYDLLKSIDFRDSNIPSSIDELITYSIPKDANLEYYTTYLGDYYTSDKKEEDAIVGKDYILNNGAHFSINIFSYKGYVQSDYNVGSEKTNYKDYYDLAKAKIVKTNFGKFYIESLVSNDMPDMALRAIVEKDEYVYEIYLSNGDEQYTGEQKEWFYEFIKSIKEK